MEDGRKRAHVWVDGVVQGVFFRASTVEEASRRGLDGWVRNMPDGRVEAVFEGDPDAVDSVLDWAREGPPRAIVERVEVAWEEPAGERGFVTRR